MSYYLDCYGGVSGDMLLSAFIDAAVPDERAKILTVLETAGGVMAPTTVKTRTIDVHGVQARILDIDFHLHPDGHQDGHHHDHGLIKGLQLRDYLEKALDENGLTTGKDFALKCLDTILDAECRVHKESLEDIHLHETGSPDTLVDLCGMAYFYEALDGADVFSTPLSVGSGKVQIAHGLVDVPAPATKLILEGMEYKPGPVDDELATPTGAALLKNLIKGFVDSVPTDAGSIGRGTGTKRFGKGFINVLSLFRGNSDRQSAGIFRRDGAVP